MRIGNESRWRWRATTTTTTISLPLRLCHACVALHCLVLAKTVWRIDRKNGWEIIFWLIHFYFLCRHAGYVRVSVCVCVCAVYACVSPKALQTRITTQCYFHTYTYICTQSHTYTPPSAYAWLRVRVTESACLLPFLPFQPLSCAHTASFWLRHDG